VTYKKKETIISTIAEIFYAIALALLILFGLQII